VIILTAILTLTADVALQTVSQIFTFGRNSSSHVEPTLQLSEQTAKLNGNEETNI